MTTDTNRDTTDDESIDPEGDIPTLRQRARAEREFRQVEELAAEGNPFAQTAVQQREHGDVDTFDDLYDLFDEVEHALGQAVMAERRFLVQEWEVAVKVPDDTPTGYRYERHVRSGDKAEVEERVERHTGYEVDREETEFVGYGRVS